MPVSLSMQAEMRAVAVAVVPHTKSPCISLHARSTLFRGRVEVRLNAGSVIAGAVIVHDGQVLLVRRTVPEGELVWQFPAGKVDPGELTQQTATREALEEAGFIVEPLFTIGERVHPMTGRHVVYVACLWLSGEPRPASPQEVSTAEWVPLTELMTRIPGGVHGPVWEYLSNSAT
ncbi:NUDIX hydrolase [Streptomyces sp. NPDC102381]|uniref:NUDIX hydrolase n=1 Tax=Streptomyces sp. NPDC102381 TaxID=3366164 RepID=UPI0037FA5D14